MSAWEQFIYLHDHVFYLLQILRLISYDPMMYFTCIHFILVDKITGTFFYI